MTSPLKWHGGKFYLASKIIALMPAHLAYVEPYFGGGSVLFAKDPTGISEVVNDVNRGLTNFWRVLADPSAFAEFYRIVQAIPFSEEEWTEQSEGWRKNGDIIISPRNQEEAVVYAVSFFTTCRQSMAGRMREFAPLSRNRIRGQMNEQASAWIGTVDKLPEVHARLRRVVIVNRPALELIRGQDGPQTLFYLDPPYLHETRATTGEYQYEMTEENHRELLATLASIKGKFILSGYDSELYRNFEQENGWRRRVFELPNNAAGGDTKRRMEEVVWMNFEPVGGAV